MGCGLTIINTFCAGIGILLIIPLLHYFGWNENLSSAEVNSGIFANLSKEISIIIILLLFVSLVILAAIIDYVNTSVTNTLKKSYLYNLKKDFNYSIAHASWSYLIEKKIKNIEHLFSAGLSQVSVLTMYSFEIISSVLITFIYMLFALVISPSLTIVTIVLSLVIFAITYKFNPVENGEKNFNIHTKMHSAFSSFLDGIKLARSYNTVDNYLDHFNTLNKQSEAVQIEFILSQKKISLFVKVSSAIIIAIFFYVALMILKTPLMYMIALLLVFSRLLPSVLKIQQNYFRILNIVPIYIQTKDLVNDLKKHEEIQYKDVNLDLDSKIEFKDVCFSYANKQVLSNLSCCLYVNQTTAIVGHSGAGKSTFADLLLGIMAIQNGSIEIDGVKLDQKYMYCWRKYISYVPQDTYLFNESIRDNLLWAVPDATDDDIYEALRLAALYDFVVQLQDGLDSIIGDRGVYLSGGQKQRLAIARALLRKPKILLLDEATSALDMRNEELIYETLKKLKGHMTIIIITHRLSTLRATDNILVFDNGKVVEQGVYDKLSNDLESRFSEIFSLNLNKNM
ncbi:ABC transporter ATP-binding protein [Francisella philomiragia]|uniref:ABC transporter family protein n=1 Tax=Francisella philomiragia TaxID=28110 RepID=A0AAW3D8F3_9GAMM|nr:ABC transporter family protein [Francisella philomiragia]MBK2255679.1 ABC transporter ATP-binding protein [Francisella philomiragia]MBK2273982.1 ABC transporter ATP-binding protein [Francisella philomiragia]MBK2277823.1 ABC transporter ATP-binding protein [Francisella philomiragia]MBK2281769.1 ABC transporter ATP-binding protein [Francisella philomiragia]